MYVKWKLNIQSQTANINTELQQFAKIISQLLISWYILDIKKPSLNILDI